MPTIGNIPVSLHTVDRNDTVYAREGNSVSHVDTVALRDPRGRHEQAAAHECALRTRLLDSCHRYDGHGKVCDSLYRGDDTARG